MNCFALPQDVTPEHITDHMTCLFEWALNITGTQRMREKHDGDVTSPQGFADLIDEPHITRWSWVVDIHGFGFRHLNPRTSIKLLELLQGIYRGRLKRLLIVDAPSMFWKLWSVVKRFIKPATAQLTEFVHWNGGSGEAGRAGGVGGAGNEADEPSADPRYRELFGDVIADALLAENRKCRDSATVAGVTWTTFFADTMRQPPNDGGD